MHDNSSLKKRSRKSYQTSQIDYRHKIKEEPLCTRLHKK